MTLHEYLIENSLSEAVFAVRIGTSQAQINRLRKGQIPGRNLMWAIHDATGGAVRADDFFELKQSQGEGA